MRPPAGSRRSASGADVALQPRPAPPAADRGRRLDGLAGTCLGTVTTSLGVSLAGTLAVQIRAGRHLSLRGLGLVVGGYYPVAAVAAAPARRLAERLGGPRTMRYSAAGAGLCLAMIAGFARSWWVLAGFLAAIGMFDAAMQSAGNLTLVRRIPLRRRGLAFGVKQAAVPFTSLLGGLAVPALGLTVGWRWAFASGCAGAVIALVAIPRPRSTLAARRKARSAPDADLAILPLLVLALGFGLAMLSITALTTFLVSSAVTVGLHPAAAGLLVALAGAAAVLVRAGMGVRADRLVGRHLRLVGVLLLLGAVGYGVLALGTTARSAPLIAAGAVVCYGAGWGWNGLFNTAVSVHHPGAPAKASGITLTGNRVAGVIGPFLFALLVGRTSYPVAWLSAGAVAPAAAGALVVGDRMLLARDAAAGALT